MRTAEEHIEVFNQAGQTFAALINTIIRLVRELGEMFQISVEELERIADPLMSPKDRDKLYEAVEEQNKKWQKIAEDAAVQRAGAYPELFLNKLQVLKPNIFSVWQMSKHST